ncbi:division/cell wall cluster transcriptional repressor MraZ [Mycoplasma sp. 480]|uniref:division/cell wall cluster transcriptional repressor MraZ n=1 Tax=Mycoplasma sp. 480 TaxID=3440155 RepID=UPI003F517AAC
MFGSHLKTIDEKNRIIIPSNFREKLGDYVYVSIGLDKVIEIRSKEEFDLIKEKLKKNNSLNKAVREFARFFFGNTTDVTIDKVGRIVLPKTLLKTCSIEKEAYLIGVGEKLELWPKEKYEKQQSKFLDDEEMDELQKTLFESGVEL